MKHASPLFLTLAILQVACSGKNAVTSECSATKSILNAQKVNRSQLNQSPTGLLLTTHYAEASPSWDGEQRLSKCNTYIELLDAVKPKIRLWSASHCFRTILLTSINLAVRDDSSSIGGFNTWELSHPILNRAKIMRAAYSELSPFTQVNVRERLVAAFDRSKMWVKDESSVLAPRTSCENIRWQTAADSVHSLCFSIHDLIYLDVELPEPDSSKTQKLLTKLSVKNSSPSSQALDQKRELFLRRINLLAQTEWITSQEQNMTNYMNNPQVSFPSTDPIAAIVARLQKSVFDLPHPEESKFMTPIEVTTQDKPVGQNETLSVIRSGTYTSPRLANPLTDVKVSCVRSLRKLNESGQVVTVSELEYRPHSYCPGGANPQANHVWYREYQWARMIADLAVGAAQEYAGEVSSQLAAQGDWKSRLTVVSNFTEDDKIDFFVEESDLVSPFLSPLKIPAGSLSSQLYGSNQFSSTGAFVLATRKDDTVARFLKGDSGALLLLDEQPIAVLYSVDGEETSGGASILPLPSAESEDDEVGARASSRNAGTRRPASSGPIPGADGACTRK